MKQYLIIPDLHFPFQDDKYLTLILKIVKLIKPYGIVQLGDALDFFQISKYEKNPARKNEVTDDITMWSRTLDKWEAALEVGGEIRLLEGNHCDRLRRFVWAQAKELHKMVATMPEMLQLRERNKRGKLKWTWHPLAKWDSCQIGDCILHHGHYFNTHVAVNNLIKYPKSLITGHTHRFQYVSNGDRFSVSLGHGSNESLTAHSPVPTGWQQALGILNLNEYNKTSFDPILVSNGKAVVYGQEIKA